MNRMNERRTLLKSVAIGLPIIATSSKWLAANEQPEQPQEDWRTWRGPSGNNIATAAASAPERITENKIVWAAEVPGRGHSSPIVVGDQVCLTTADKSVGTQSVLAFDRETGAARWTRLVHQGGLATQNHPKNTEASSTLATDGQHLFAVFYNSASLRLTAIDLSGKIVWEENLGHYNPQLFKYGYAASPALYKDLIIVVGDYDGQAFLTARNRMTGKEVWRTARPVTISFSSPIIANTGGRDQLLLSGGNAVISYDPHTGEVLWQSEATSMATCGTMVWNNELVFASGGYPKSETACIRSNGSGEVVWTNNQKCYEQSMLYHDGYLYAVTDAGVAYCWKAETGETMWRERLGGAYSSSPLLVGELIYVFNEAGQGFVFRASPKKYESISQSKIADDVFPTPVVVNNKMFMRLAKQVANSRQEYLVAISD